MEHGDVASCTLNLPKPRYLRTIVDPGNSHFPLSNLNFAPGENCMYLKYSSVPGRHQQYVGDLPASFQLLLGVSRTLLPGSPSHLQRLLRPYRSLQVSVGYNRFAGSLLVACHVSSAKSYVCRSCLTMV